jgi:hypothetical protein
VVSVRTAFVLLLLVLSGLTTGVGLRQAGAESLESVLMPGKVIRGHAKTEEKCAGCHVRFDREGQNRLCRDCHKDVGQDMAQKQGFHGRIKEQSCRTCHTEHKGREARIVVLDEKRFDHKQTDYPLKGKHLEAECGKCHLSGQKFRSAQSTCVACHKGDDAHKGKLGTKCADCHTELDWKEARFDHDTTNFKLEDKHAKAKCKDCHDDSGFKGTSMACVSCHRKDDKHKGRFGEKCQSCHNAKAWDGVVFDHDKDTKYSLRGKHRQARCDACHVGNPYREPLQTACVACHKKDDKHKGSLGEKCNDCHVERDWNEARFDHGRSRFPLLGKHDDIECKACHKSPIFKDTPMTCIACHKKDDKHKGSLGEKCGDCHIERNWKENRFDHGKTRFALVGKHQAVKCDSCHKDQKFKGTPDACLACHKKDDVHKGQLGDKCEQCHSAQDWKQTTFSHARTRFPLLGRHLVVECKKCHATAQYKDAKKECLACHEKDDVHKRSLGVQCETCHNPRDWKLWDFNHSTQTRFKLEGGHKALVCNSCHRKPVTGKAVLPMACVSCHEKDDVHEGAFGRQCDKCHGVDSFKQSRLRMGQRREGKESMSGVACSTTVHGLCQDWPKQHGHAMQVMLAQGGEAK